MPWGEIVAGIFGILVVLGAWFGTKNSGRNKERAIQAKKTIEALNDAKDIQNESLPVDLDDIDSELRDR